MSDQLKINFQVEMTEDEFNAYQVSTDVLSSDTVISITETNEKFMATGNAGEVVPLFTNRLKNVTTGKFEVATVGNEYVSLNQYGGIYGTVYRRYHNTAANGGYLSIPGITKLVDYGGTFNGDNVYHGATTDAPNNLYLYRGTDRVTFTISGWALDTGWVDYTK